MAQLAALFGSAGANIADIIYNRLSLQTGLRAVVFDVTVEADSACQMAELIAALTTEGINVHIKRFEHLDELLATSRELFEI